MSLPNPSNEILKNRLDEALVEYECAYQNVPLEEDSYEQIPVKVVYPLTKQVSVLDKKKSLKAGGHMVVNKIIKVVDINYKWCMSCGTVYYGKDCCSRMLLCVPLPHQTQVDAVIFHKGCPDGIGSAWAVRRYFSALKGFRSAVEKLVFYGAKHESKGSEKDLRNIRSMCKGRNVLIADFAYPPNVILEIKKVCNTFVLLDHHKSNEQLLINEPNCFFDMDHSGAYLTWAFMITGKPLVMPTDIEAPKIIQYIQDRDIWAFKLPHSREINIALGLHSKGNMDNLDSLDFGGEETLKKLAIEGSYYLKFQKESIESSMVVSSSVCSFLGVKSVVINTCNSPSDTAELLLAHDKYRDCRIALVIKWSISKKHYKINLRRRSEDDDLDLGYISKRYFEGGGHPEAAGFTISDEVAMKYIFLLYRDSSNGSKVSYQLSDPNPNAYIKASNSSVVAHLNSQFIKTRI